MFVSYSAKKFPFSSALENAQDKKSILLTTC